MKIKRIVFWAHLGAGVAAGIFILIMAVTGALLTFERQMVAGAEQRNHLETIPATAALGANELANIAYRLAPQASRASLVFKADPAAPVSVWMGRQGSVLLNPYTGAVMDDAAAGLAGFFRLMENWHRSLNLESRALGSTVIRAANLLFLFLIVSGIYLWLPDVWRWPAVRFRMLFAARPVNGKMRDFNWHHVFSFWALIPLFLIAFSGVVMSYGWANNLVFAAFGEQAPQRGGPRGGTGGGPDGPRRFGPLPQVAAAGAAPRTNLDALLAAAKSQVGSWHTISLPIAGSGDRVNITIEQKSAALRAPRQTLTLNAADASIVALTLAPGGAPTQASSGQRARIWLRFVHTGQQYGIVGQTIAGLASLAACFLVYTALALAYRRLVQPLLRRA